MILHILTKNNLVNKNAERVFVYFCKTMHWYNMAHTVMFIKSSPLWLFFIKFFLIIWQNPAEKSCKTSIIFFVSSLKLLNRFNMMVGCWYPNCITGIGTKTLNLWFCNFICEEVKQHRRVNISAQDLVNTDNK